MLLSRDGANRCTKNRFLNLVSSNDTILPEALMWYKEQRRPLERGLNRLVSKVLQVPSPPKTRHYTGFPPGVPGQETGKLMETADILVIKKEKDGILLYRYTVIGSGFVRLSRLLLPGRDRGCRCPKWGPNGCSSDMSKA